MAVVENLDVLVSAKTKDFDKNIKKAEDRTKKFSENVKPWIEAIFGNTGGALFQAFAVGGAIGAGIAAAQMILEGFVNALKRVTQAIIQLVADGFSKLDGLYDTAKRIGIAAKSLVALQLAAKFSGSDVETLNDSLQKMTRNIAEAAHGSGSAKDALRELGLEAKELNALSPDQQFSKLADAIAKVGTNGEKLRVINDVFGKSGASLIELLSGGSKAVDEFAAKAKKLGLVFSDSQLEKVGQAVDAYDEFKLSIAGFGQHVAVALAPLATGLLNLLTDNIVVLRNAVQPLLDKFREWSGVMIQVANIASMAFQGIVMAAGDILKIIAYVSGAGTAFEVFGKNSYSMAVQVMAGLAVVEWAIKNMQLIFYNAFLKMTLWATTFYETFKHMFTVSMPQIAKAFAKAMAESMNALMNRDFEGVGKAFAKGMINAMSSTRRELSETEKYLQKKIAASDKHLKTSLMTSVMARLRQLHELINFAPDKIKEPVEDEIKLFIRSDLYPAATTKGSLEQFEQIMKARGFDKAPSAEKKTEEEILKVGIRSEKHLKEIASKSTILAATI